MAVWMFQAPVQAILLSLYKSQLLPFLQHDDDNTTCPKHTSELAPQLMACRQTQPGTVRTAYQPAALEYILMKL